MPPEFLFERNIEMCEILCRFSYDRDQPFTFQLGAGQVIKGWDQGLLDMCVGEFPRMKNMFENVKRFFFPFFKGEKRKLTIPPHLGYGDRGAGNVIPGLSRCSINQKNRCNSSLF